MADACRLRRWLLLLDLNLHCFLLRLLLFRLGCLRFVRDWPRFGQVVVDHVDLLLIECCFITAAHELKLFHHQAAVLTDLNEQIEIVTAGLSVAANALNCLLLLRHVVLPVEYPEVLALRVDDGDPAAGHRHCVEIPVEFEPTLDLDQLPTCFLGLRVVHFDGLAEFLDAGVLAAENVQV